jgi:enamine deaminase RidA (YjgF/YER057c/UK114 family)
MTDTRTPHEVLHPSNWKKASGYANGLLSEGKVVWIGGQIGWTGDQVFEATDLAGQTQQALRNIVAIAREAGARPEHIVRMTWYVTDKKDYLANLKGVGEAYRSVMGKHFPAMTMVQVADLIEDEAKVEIEATAVLPTT